MGIPMVTFQMSALRVSHHASGRAELDGNPRAYSVTVEGRRSRLPSAGCQKALGSYTYPSE